MKSQVQIDHYVRLLKHLSETYYWYWIESCLESEATSSERVGARETRQNEWKKEQNYVNVWQRERDNWRGSQWVRENNWEKEGQRVNESEGNEREKVEDMEEWERERKTELESKREERVRETERFRDGGDREKEKKWEEEIWNVWERETLNLRNATLLFKSLK